MTPVTLIWQRRRMLWNLDALVADLGNGTSVLVLLVPESMYESVGAQGWSILQARAGQNEQGWRYSAWLPVADRCADERHAMAVAVDLLQPRTAATVTDA